MRLAYVYSKELCAAADLLPSNKGRSSLIHSLISAYKLLSSDQVVVIRPKPATRQELLAYHDEDFIDALLSADDPSTLALTDEEMAEFGLEYDCPLFNGISTYITHVAGASLYAAKALCSQSHDFTTAVCFDGGRHHARKREAYGFCYINDINLSILQLRSTFDRVMYIDLDLHHGDGVESCFKYTDKVLTCSVHRHGPGFFPRSGSADEIGKGKGEGYSLNVPLKRGLTDVPFLQVINEIVIPAIREYRPEAVVVQCGVDGLHGDPYKEWNLSINGFSKAVDLIQREAMLRNIKTLYLGGGGYESSIVSSCYATILAALLNTNDLPDAIPEHSRWAQYSKRDYCLGRDEVSGVMLDANADITQVIDRARKQLSNWRNDSITSD